MKVTLLVNGQEMTFTNVENISILEESSETKDVLASYEVAQKPTEGKCFEVNPLAISQELFKKKRENSSQETTRKLIVEAFTEMKNNPGKYGKPFQTMIPEKTWDSKTVAELNELATSLGDCIADWVHQALEWAQRIVNGESWETICNEADTADWYRLVVWKNGYARLVGGSRNSDNNYPASHVHGDYYSSSTRFSCIVPSVVLYK